jgi:two-component system, NarL family, sensor histidine kinase UhpB
VTLKFKLHLVVSFLLLLFMLGGLTFNVYNARDNVRAEVESTEKLTLYLFDTAILDNKEILKRNLGQKPFKLQSLKHMRHVKIEYFDANNKLTDSNRDDENLNFVEAPKWFEGIISAVSTEWSQKSRAVELDGKVLGRIEITPDPRYEYAEIWKQMKDAFILVVIYFVLVNLLISFVVNYALRPTTIIHNALQRLGEGDLKARLPAFETHELKNIGEKFNEMAEKLEDSIQRNHELSRQLITVQEAERKSIARDLHDEFGQSLTAIQADSQAALTVARKKCPEAVMSIEAISDISKHLMKVVSGLLHRLRPQILDELGLEVAIEDLVEQWRARFPKVQFDLRMVEHAAEGLSEPFTVAIYRMVQECLTNVSRHSAASQVVIEVYSKQDTRGQRKLQVSIQDNGHGFDVKKATGFGLAGMKERFEGLNGELIILSSGKGTVVTALVPLEAKA